MGHLVLWINKGRIWWQEEGIVAPQPVEKLRKLYGSSVPLEKWRDFFELLKNFSVRWVWRDEESALAFHRFRKRNEVELVRYERTRKLKVLMRDGVSQKLFAAVRKFLTSEFFLKSRVKVEDLRKEVEKWGGTLSISDDALEVLRTKEEKRRVRFSVKEGKIVVALASSYKRFANALSPLLEGGALKHPLLLKVACSLVKDRDGEPVVSDSAWFLYSNTAYDSVFLAHHPFFFNQVHVFHDPKHLREEYASLLKMVIDDFGNVVNWEEFERVFRELKEAGCRIKVDPEVLHTIEVAEAVAEGDFPQILNGELYPYQRQGAAFLYYGKRCLLADDMGLGKTVQAIAAAELMLRRGEAHRVLVLCPSSVKNQWSREVERWTGRKAVVVSGSPGKRRELYREDGEFFVINYELLLRDFEHVESLKADVLILDEAQRIKNHEAKTTKLVSQLESSAVFALTGTPLENSLLELYTIMRILNPNVLGSNVLKFIERYVVRDRFGGVRAYKRVDEVKARVRGVMLRRRKAEVLDQLPPRIENDFEVELSPKQRSLYEKYREEVLNLLNSVDWENPFEVRKVWGRVTYLREICDSAELVDPEIRASSKLEELRGILEEVTPEHKVIVFSQWERMVRILERELGGFGSLCFTGSLNAKEREDVLKRFWEDEKIRVLFATDAGGVGLNLQVADYVVNFDLPYNPAKVEQRIGRAHRLGQKGVVNVINILAKNTVEAKVKRVLYKKKKLFGEVVEEVSELRFTAKGAKRILEELLK